MITLQRAALFSVLLAFAAPLPCQAFHLGDHKRITIQAVDELNACFPGLISEVHEAALWASNLEEDIDLLRKDLLYSHFFNPHKHLRMWRLDSSARISDLKDSLAADAGEGDRDGLGVFVHLGHLVHHLQDMAVPPHVVPVMHGLSDGFEKYELNGDISSGLSCADLVSAGRIDPSSLLVDTAERTLGQVATLRWDITAASRATTAGGDAFWKDSGDNRFGDYGWLGNHFGETSFEQDGIAYAVPEALYATFKQAQMKSATRATLEALYWALLVNP